MKIVWYCESENNWYTVKSIHHNIKFKGKCNDFKDVPIYILIYYCLKLDLYDKSILQIH